MEKNSISAYDLPARVISYDKDMDIMHPRRSKMIDIALEFLPVEKDSQITALELGAGTGYFTKRFLEKYPDAKIIAVDGAENMIELAKARLGYLSNKIDFRIADFRKLNSIISADEKADVVFSSYSLHHLTSPEKEAVVRKCAEFLKEGGWFINADLITAEN
ncbi:class I SAM-dependent methyltransferase, partial [candidate division KSB1 bacterium]